MQFKSCAVLRNMSVNYVLALFILCWKQLFKIVILSYYSFAAIFWVVWSSLVLLK